MLLFQVGDSIPNVDLFEGAPDKKVNLAEECKSGKFVIFGVPGAFTPGCSKTHLPGYVSSAGDLKAKGVKDIFCIAVNDPFVMSAWGANQVLNRHHKRSKGMSSGDIFLLCHISEC